MRCSILLLFFVISIVLLGVPYATRAQVASADAKIERELVRIGIFTTRPALVVRQIKKDFVAWGLRPAGEVGLGERTSDGFYFHTVLRRDQLVHALGKIQGRVVIASEPDPRWRRHPRGSLRVILTVNHEHVVYAQDHYRIYQTVPNPDQVGSSLQSLVKQVGGTILENVPLRGEGDPGRHLRIEIPRDQLGRFIDESIPMGPLELRQESTLQAPIETVRLRYVVDYNPSLRASQPGVNQNRLYLIRFTTLALEVRTFDLFKRHHIQSDLIGPISGLTVDQVELSPSQMAPLLVDLAAVGTVSVEARTLSAKVDFTRSQGSHSAIFEIFSLADFAGIQPSVSGEVPATPPSERLRRPESFIKPLPMTVRPQTEPENQFTLYVDPQTPTQTYLNEVTLRGFVEPGVNLEASSGLSMDEKRIFVWKLAGLEYDRENTREIQVNSIRDRAVSRYSIKRFRPLDVNFGGGAIPTGGSLTPFLGGAIRYWFEGDLKANDRSRFQRLGLSASHFAPLGELGRVARKLPRPMETYNLHYRLKPGIHNQDDTAILTLSLRQPTYQGVRSSLLGFGLAYSSRFPEAVDSLLRRLPLLGFPKRIDVEIQSYPFIFGSGNEVYESLGIVVEPRMVLSPRYYIFGHTEVSVLSYRERRSLISTNYLIGYAGIGALF